MLQTLEERKRLPGELIKPREGRDFIVALLVGGAGGVKFELLKEEFANERGIWLAHHWEERRPRQFEGMPPRDVDVVLALTGFLGHPYYYKAVRAVERANNAPDRRSIVILSIDQGQASTMERLGFTKKPPIDRSKLYKKADGESSHGTEARLATLGERNAEIAEINAVLASIEPVNADTTAQAPVEQAAPVAPAAPEPSIALLATMTRLLELMRSGSGLYQITRTDVRAAAEGGSITIEWQNLPAANDNAPSK